MECRERDWHEFLNVSLQTVDVRKARKMVMKSEIMQNTTNKTHINSFRVVDHEKKIRLKKIA